MKNLYLKTITEITHGEILQGQNCMTIVNLAFKRTDIKQGTLFFDLYKKKNPPLTAWPENILFSIITDRPQHLTNIPRNITLIRVDDINTAYWRFVEYYRGLFHIPVIGVTGTCGKTSTKEMIRHILSQRLNVNATYKSYNAQIHHLEYLLEFDSHTQAAVIEMGVAVPEDLTTACRYFKPQVGIITNIGIDHLNAFGSQERYIEAKAEFINGLDRSGTLIINADDENIKKINFDKFNGSIVKFGFGDDSQYKITDLKQLENTLEFVIKYKDIFYKFNMPGYGEFMVQNAAAAIAAAHAIGFSVKEAGDALRTFHNIERHFELKKGINGSTVIDDTWSSNPTSAVESLKMLKKLSNGRKTIAVLGKMSLLGKKSDYYHRFTGESAATIGVDKLIIIDMDAREIGIGALNSGMKPEQVHFCDNLQQAYDILKNLMDKNSVTLIKTSMLSSYKSFINKLTIN